MGLTQEEKNIIIQLLSQISIPVNQAPVVLKIIQKLQSLSPTEKEEVSKSIDSPSPSK